MGVADIPYGRDGKILAPRTVCRQAPFTDHVAVLSRSAG